VGKVIIPDDDAIAVVDEEETNRNGENKEEEAAKEDALTDDNCENCNVVHEAEGNSPIHAEVAAEVAFADMVAKKNVNAAIVGTVEPKKSLMPTPTTLPTTMTMIMAKGKEFQWPKS
jgi:hypothetical protein